MLSLTGSDLKFTQPYPNERKTFVVPLDAINKYSIIWLYSRKYDEVYFECTEKFFLVHLSFCAYDLKVIKSAESI